MATPQSKPLVDFQTDRYENVLSQALKTYEEIKNNNAASPHAVENAKKTFISKIIQHIEKLESQAKKMHEKRSEERDYNAQKTWFMAKEEILDIKQKQPELLTKELIESITKIEKETIDLDVDYWMKTYERITDKQNPESFPTEASFANAVCELIERIEQKTRDDNAQIMEDKETVSVKTVLVTDQEHQRNVDQIKKIKDYRWKPEQAQQIEEILAEQNKTREKHEEKEEKTIKSDPAKQEETAEEFHKKLKDKISSLLAKEKTIRKHKKKSNSATDKQGIEALFSEKEDWFKMKQEILSIKNDPKIFQDNEFKNLHSILFIEFETPDLDVDYWMERCKRSEEELNNNKTELNKSVSNLLNKLDLIKTSLEEALTALDKIKDTAQTNIKNQHENNIQYWKMLHDRAMSQIKEIQDSDFLDKENKEKIKSIINPPKKTEDEKLELEPSQAEKEKIQTDARKENENENAIKEWLKNYIKYNDSIKNFVSNLDPTTELEQALHKFREAYSTLQENQKKEMENTVGQLAKILEQAAYLKQNPGLKANEKIDIGDLNTELNTLKETFKNGQKWTPEQKKCFAIAALCVFVAIVAVLSVFTAGAAAGVGAGLYMFIHSTVGIGVLASAPLATATVATITANKKINSDPLRPLQTAHKQGEEITKAIEKKVIKPLKKGS